MSSLTYANVQVALPTTRLTHYLHRHFTMDVLQGIPELATFEPWVYLPKPVPLKVNQLYWPSGATRWGRMLMFCTSSQLRAIWKEVEKERAATQGNGLYLEVRPPDQNLKAFRMTPLSPVRLSPYLGDAFDGEDMLYLLPLVDDRFWWQYRTGEIVMNTYSTWQDLFDQLETVLSISIDLGDDAVDAAYLNPSKEVFNTDHANAAHLFELAAWSICRRVELDIGVNNSVPLVWLTSAQECDRNFETLSDHFNAREVDRGLLLAGGGQNSRLSLPEKVRMIFPKSKNRQLLGKDEMYTYDESPIEIEAEHLETGTVKAVRSRANADFTSGGSVPDNDADLAMLAMRWAEDWYLLHDNRFHFVSTMEGNVWQTGKEDARIYKLYSMTGDAQPDHVAFEIECWSMPWWTQEEDLAHGYEQLLEWNRIYKFVADETILVDSNGQASIYLGGADSNINVEAWLNWAEIDPRMSTGKEGFLTWFPDEEKHIIIGRDCEDS